MKICIDGIGLSNLKGTSLYSYTSEFLNNLFEMYLQPEYQVVWGKSKYITSLGEKNKLSYLNLEMNRAKNDYRKLEQHIKKDNVKLYHSLNNGFSIPFEKNCKNVSTIYDLSPMENMLFTDKKYYEKFMTVFPNTVEKSDKIIVVSNFIKKQIIKYFHIDENNIKVIYPGCSKQFEPIEYEVCKKVLKNNYNIEGDFLLYVGSVHQRKNLHILFKVLKQIKEYRYTKDIKLVILGKYDGKREEYYSKLKILAEHLKIKDSIIFTGTVDYKDVKYFYNAAQCLINLSQYDGFPLSVLEAMACKTPVICNNNDLFKEVVGEGGILVDIDDEMYMKDAVLETLLNKNYRNFVGESGKKQSEKYKWSNSIEKTIEIYESLAY
ncbi:glycosyltransferase family 1 protein [Clostridium aestuarii]|uniref:Glycosyltransferase family 1 protein n=1 Tax=Clostridium aestuarii TaxID=338193 RepID=A0ABT4CW07_9CLOT|nr:glycosyltransferase family 1 protein [Clostridium aestuarii]MCY6483163.1 glycosyltransferase family 1 protein [Clostridium aestuarii]